MAFLRSSRPPPALHKIPGPRLPAISPDPLHLPRRRHAFRRRLRQQRSRLLGRIYSRVHARLSSPARPGRRTPFRASTPCDSPRPRTPPFFPFPPPPHSLHPP